MIAIPVARRDGNVLKNLNLFTKAKLIALVDDNNQIEVIEHEHPNGKALAQDLVRRGVTVLITNHMGKTPFNILTAAGVELVYRDGSMELSELLALYRSNQLKPLTADMAHCCSHDKHA